MQPKVLVFDSGVGGLSVLQEIHALTPGLAIHYLMDNAAFPYGTKADDFLVQRVLKVCHRAVAETQADLLVVACNTASTLALEELRQNLTIPIVGVVPAIKVAAEQAQNGHIGLLATAATVKRSYTQKLIDDFSAGKPVSLFGSPLLVQWAETWLLHNQPINEQELFAHLNPWIIGPPALSHIVLGCTHFPLLKPYLLKLWPKVQWIDSGAAIARRVKQLLSLPDTSAQSVTQSDVTLHWTDQQVCPVGVAQFLAQHYSLKQQQAISIPCPVNH